MVDPWGFFCLLLKECKAGKTNGLNNFASVNTTLRCNDDFGDACFLVSQLDLPIEFSEQGEPKKLSMSRTNISFTRKQKQDATFGQIGSCTLEVAEEIFALRIRFIANASCLFLNALGELQKRAIEIPSTASWKQ